MLREDGPAPSRSAERAERFHLDELTHVQAFLSELDGTCLDPVRPRSAFGPREQLASNAELFTTGSAPRDVWVHSGLGATVDATVVATDTPLELIDLCSMTANTILGINDPWVRLKQASYLVSSRPHYLTARMGNDLTYRVARRILDCFRDDGGPDDYVVNLRQCNGSDAVELALHAAWKAAAATPGRRKLATFRGSYHGESLTANWVSEHQPGRLLADAPDNVVFFPTPELDDAGELSASAASALETLERDGDSYFAVIVEPIQWRNSVHTVPVEFLRRLREVCTRKSVCLVFDEMQNAFGYTGSLGYARTSGVSPDISAISKALTSGHGSLAIIVARRGYGEIETPFGAKSNSGNMLALVAVDAVLDRLLGLEEAERKTLPAWLPSGLAAELRDGLLASAYPRAVALVDELLDELRRRFPTLVGPPRGVGLVRGLVMLDADGRPSARLAAAAAKVCLTHGVYVRQADTAVLLKPCLVLSRAETATALDALTKTFADVLRLRDAS
ncbi:aminotransferase class III-fold pyridoxal phosphate-dependent enzyme [Streptomyces naphthomycinicus]|uniref:aminotransferase class III-fold pyridoxal phosphate-dependent enzyme n=1 Tax=Streptomyces naphthomycinicus TaxID=2872625 RepID=UPI001CEC0246|nr:aminotransferase class III-fold pyridoxal phosphate-dependent enzyme [Streptomyces sp. TML10]